MTAPVQPSLKANVLARTEVGSAPMLEATRANACDGRSFRDSRTVLRFAFGTHLQAGFSAANIDGIPITS
jgi:hypothetical protein